MVARSERCFCWCLVGWCAGNIITTFYLSRLLSTGSTVSPIEEIKKVSIGRKNLPTISDGLETSSKTNVMIDTSSTVEVPTNSTQIVQEGDYIYGSMPMDYDSSPIVLKKYRLVFFTIPKVGCTVFKQLFRRMEGYRDWREVTIRTTHQPGANGLTYLSDLSLEEVVDCVCRCSRHCVPPPHDAEGSPGSVQFLIVASTP